jgi:hypothetical protein
MKNIGCFNQLLQDLEYFCLTNVFAFEHPWNREIILQFYATLYISGDESESSKWIMEWMTEGKRIKCTSTDFVSHFHFPRFEHGNNEIQVHSIHAIFDETFRRTMDEDKIRDYTGPPLPEHLTFKNQTLYHMLSYTICPLARMNTDKSISDVLRNAIYAIYERYIFDVEDMFLRILKDSAQYPNYVKFYPPWIQKVVDHAMRTEYLAKQSHKSFIPPVHDTMQIMEDISLENCPRQALKIITTHSTGHVYLSVTD